MSTTDRITDLEATVERLERKIVMLETDVARHERQIKEYHGAIFPIPSTGGRGYMKRDPVVRAANLARSCAKARASKDVGEGKGAVRTERTRKRLQRQRDELDRDEQAAIESGTARTRKKKEQGYGRRRQ